LWTCGLPPEPLLSGSYTLAALARLLRTKTESPDTENDLGPIDAQLLDGLTTTVQVTWECFEILAERYRGYGLPQTPVSAIYSEASVGKACVQPQHLRTQGFCPARARSPRPGPHRF
jgi:hypothetical protein